MKDFLLSTSKEYNGLNQQNVLIISKDHKLGTSYNRYDCGYRLRYGITSNEPFALYWKGKVTDNGVEFVGHRYDTLTDSPVANDITKFMDFIISIKDELGIRGITIFDTSIEANHYVKQHMKEFLSTNGDRLIKLITEGDITSDTRDSIEVDISRVFKVWGKLERYTNITKYSTACKVIDYLYSMLPDKSTLDNYVKEYKGYLDLAY